jgi:choline dehydrogenase-like flavoprotein
LRNLKVVTEAAVVALIADPGGSRVRGVEVLDATQRRRRFLAERVILANGTMEIARLLLLPFADGRRTPWADNRWLGRGFMDHIDCYAGAVAPLNKKAFHLLFDNLRFRGVKYQPKLRLKEDAQRRRRLVDISGHFVFNSSLSEQLADAKVFFKALLRGRLHGSLHDLPQRLRPLASVGAPMIIRYLRYRRIYNYTDGGIQLRLTSEQIMRPNSRLHLLEKKDSLNMPMIAVDWQVDGREFETFRVFAELVKGYLQSAGLANVHLDQRLVNGDPSFLNSLDDANHHMGMTRMSDDADRGVVDRNLRVHRAEGLFVAGAAVFPSTGFANPTFTAIALGLRLSRAIQERIV